MRNDHPFRIERSTPLIPLGGVRDPEVLRRIQERSAKIRERIGPTNIAVELIREGRDEE